MPLLKYFLTVGAVLMVGLFALNAYLEPEPSDAAAKVSVAATLLTFGTAPSPPPKKSK
jgi:hypothetical protein